MAELLKVREITIDTIQHKEFNKKEEELKLIRFYQNDLNSAKLLINVTHDKVVTDFSSAISVQIAFLKPDGKRVFQDVQNVNQMQGKYYVVLSTQTLIAYGNVIAQLRFTFPNNKVIETCMLAFTVDESIMSDDAMKSTNEFPVIQKAIEAGKKLEGVDINGIIAAGAKADAALPKAGGTMTGDLQMERGTGEKAYSFVKAGVVTAKLLDNDTRTALYSQTTGETVWRYEKASKTFEVASNTNLVKKTEIYNDWLQPTGVTKFMAVGTDLNSLRTSGIFGGSGFLNAPNGDVGFYYVEVFQYNDLAYTIQRASNLTTVSNAGTWVRRRSNSVWGAWELLVDSKGGTFTGNVFIEPDKGVIFKSNGSTKNIYTMKGHPSENRLLFEDLTGGTRVFEYLSDSRTLNFLTDTNLAKKAGDTFTGTMNFNGVTMLKNNVEHVYDQAGQKGVTMVINNATNKWAIGPKVAGSVDWSKELSLSLDTGVVTVSSLATKLDGRTNIPLSSEATAPDVNYILAAIRSNNVVTLKGAVTLNANATGVIVATLPPELRPSGGNLSIYTPATDLSTNVQVFVNGTTGAVAFSANAKGKRVDFVITYVV